MTEVPGGFCSRLLYEVGYDWGKKTWFGRVVYTPVYFILLFWVVVGAIAHIVVGLMPPITKGDIDD